MTITTPTRQLQWHNHQLYSYPTTADKYEAAQHTTEKDGVRYWSKGPGACKAIHDGHEPLKGAGTIK